MRDIQSQKDTRNIDIQKVGIKHLELPLIIQRKNSDDQTVCARAKASVSLPHCYKGTHMSRFVEVLNDWSCKNLLSTDIEGCLKEIVSTLDAQSGELELNFTYFVDKKSPVTGLTAPMSYECSFCGKWDGDPGGAGDYNFTLGAIVPVTTLCPCSKEISENGAHNQRACINVKVCYDNHIWLEDLIELVESCASSPVYPLLKREDEKFVTELAYQNPKFVEDVLRDCVLKLRAHPSIKKFEVECEAFESIHNHSAWAYQSETTSPR